MAVQRITAEFPASLKDHVMQKVEQSIITSVQQEPSLQVLRVGDFILTPQRYDRERGALIVLAETDAISQWEQLENSPEKEIKYSLSNITEKVTNERSILGALIKDKAVDRAVEEQFWSTVSQQEAQNEARFSEFWRERVVSRYQIYNDGLVSIEDQKLRDQLAELFASYTQSELLPDSTTRARSQGLVLSRKTRKNVSKLETISKAGKMDIAGVLAALDRFNKKQGIEAPTSSQLEEVKKAMVGDMIRRMQKQKQSDGPVLFLMLVVVLFAKHYHGVVYATGKFAPKLLKQLKAVLEAEQYGLVEKWKEAAKSSTLTAEDRAEMKKMAEA